VPADHSAGVQASASTAAGAEAPTLLVLADCVDGGIGLWKLESTGNWQTVDSLPDGQAIARDDTALTIARTGSLETRTLTAPAATTASVTLKWPGAASSAPIRAISRSSSGSTAIVTSDERSQAYPTVSADGTVTPLRGAPGSSFAPPVAWIDADRLLALGEGTDASSRLVVLGSSTGISQTISTLTGVRWFALSGDRSIATVALDSGIYVTQVSVLLNGDQPVFVGSLGSSQKVLQLALDQSGTRLAALVSTTMDDGTSVNTRELGYTKSHSGWTWTYDGPAPFTRALGQVWLG
jgi:hypothetical protein